MSIEIGGMIVEYSFIIAVIPVILVVAFLVWIAKKITDGERLDMKEGVLGVVILMVAVLIMVPMISSTQVYTWDDDTGELVIQQNLTGGFYAWDTYDSQIRSIVIKPGVTQIGNSAFDGATNIEYLSIPESVTDIGTNAFGVDFYDMSGQQMPDVRTGEFLGVGDGNVYYCDPTLYTYDGAKITGLASGASPTILAIPSMNAGASITTIGQAAFRYNADVTTLLTNPNTETVGNNAFRDMTALTTAILNKAEYGNDIFRGCTSLADVDFYEGITEIPTGAFAQCSALDVALPTTLTVINGSAFIASGIVTADMPNVTEIGSSAFYNCSSLTSLTMPSIESIAETAFNAVRITSLEIPASLTTIGENAFRSVTTITSVSFASGFDGTFSDSMPNWTFYDSDGTTVLAKTAATMAGHTFQGTNTALVKVAAGQLSLTPEQLQQVQLHTQELQDISIEPLPLQPSLQEQELTA